MITKVISSRFEYYMGFAISMGALVLCSAFTESAVRSFDYVRLFISGPFFIASFLYCIRYWNKYIFMDIGLDGKIHFGSIRLKGIAEIENVKVVKKVFFGTYKIIIEGETYYLYSRPEAINLLS